MRQPHVAIGYKNWAESPNWSMLGLYFSQTSNIWLSSFSPIFFYTKWILCLNNSVSLRIVVFGSIYFRSQCYQSASTRLTPCSFMALIRQLFSPCLCLVIQIYGEANSSPLFASLKTQHNKSKNSIEYLHVRPVFHKM
jgi:hypothetical protein